MKLFPSLRRSSILDPRSSIFVVLGIGNPGREYEQTRHNLGFMVVDLLAAAHNIPVRRRKFHSLCGEGAIAGVRVALLKPLTFVNSSGLAAGEALRHFKVPPSRLLVICDDLNLPTGKLRIRRDGSAGGHHGLESIAEKLVASDFPRIRIGIDRPAQAQRGRNVTGHVLSPFCEDEDGVIQESIERAAEAVVCMLSDGIEQAMSRFN